MPTHRSHSGVEEATTHSFQRTMDGERLISVFQSLVEPLGRSLPAGSEVVLHDLSLLPNSIVAIHGGVTGREVGDPATDLLLEASTSGTSDSMVGYESVLADGRRVRSATMIIRDISGSPVAALCINTDLTVWSGIEQLASSMTGGGRSEMSAISQIPIRPLAGASADSSTENFVRDIDELAAIMIRRSIDDIGVPVELMKKRHKLDVVRQLKRRGVFMLRDAVEMIAESLNVTRFTIYNYLNEIGEEATDQESG